LADAVRVNVGFLTAHQSRYKTDEAIQRSSQAGPKRVVEIGCGPGNTLFPLLAANENVDLQLHGFDFSKEAIDLVKVYSSAFHSVFSWLQN
jgi:ubiquinone/menaquinone biosynthesis C-methylase UbiE